MKNKGFTLIELLAVFVILAVLVTITIVFVGDIISNSERSLSDTQKKNLEKAAEAYNIKEGLDINATCVSIETLINGGYLSRNIVTDLETRNQMTGSVRIQFNSNSYTYTYQTSGC